jgi:hypothetical protein
MIGRPSGWFEPVSAITVHRSTSSLRDDLGQTPLAFSQRAGLVERKCCNAAGIFQMLT